MIILESDMQINLASRMCKGLILKPIFWLCFINQYPNIRVLPNLLLIQTRLTLSEPLKHHWYTDRKMPGYNNKIPEFDGKMFIFRMKKGSGHGGHLFTFIRNYIFPYKF